jgi:hypothetical protein
VGPHRAAALRTRSGANSACRSKCASCALDLLRSAHASPPHHSWR